MDFVHLRRAQQLADEQVQLASAELAAVAPDDVSVWEGKAIPQM